MIQITAQYYGADGGLAIRAVDGKEKDRLSSAKCWPGELAGISFPACVSVFRSRSGEPHSGDSAMKARELAGPKGSFARTIVWWAEGMRSRQVKWKAYEGVQL